MAGNANSGRRREPIPTGKQAEEELRRIRRNERRAARRAAKAGQTQPETPSDELDTPAPASFSGALPTAEELKLMFAEAFTTLGGVNGLVQWGQRYPKEFYAIWARLCLPKDAEGPSENSLEAMLARLDAQSPGVPN